MTTTPPSTPPSPEAEAPPEPRLGLNLAADLAQHLAATTPLTREQVADTVSAWVTQLADVESFRDDAGRVWVQAPVFDPEGRVLPFDRRNVAALETTAAAVLLNSPEAVAVFGGVVYPSAYREARIARVMWLGRAGEVVEPSDIFNSLDVIAMLHEAMFVRLQQRREHEQGRVAALLTEQRDLLARSNELLAAEVEANERRLRDAAGAAPEGEAGPAGAGGGP